SSIGMPQEVLSPPVDVRNRWTVVPARTFVVQLAKISDVIANERRRIGMQMRDQQSADHFSVKCGRKLLIAFDNDIAVSHMIIAFMLRALERDRPGFSRGIIR